MEIIGYLITGLVSGILGGLIGIGGGAIVVPALTLIFHKSPHLAIAASLVQMVFVASSSAYGHWKNGYILKAVVMRLVPLAAAFAIVGVFVGSAINGALLARIFAVFLVYVAADSGYKLVRNIIKRRQDEEPLSQFRPRNEWGIPAVAVPMGFSCGVLGIGGGSIAVPMLHMFLKLPLKNAIANSAAAIFFSSIIASVVKLMSINGMVVDAAGGTTAVLHWYDALVVGLLLAPGSFAGGRLGAHLAKKAPTKIIQAVFILVLLYSAYGMWQKAEKPAKGEAHVGAEAPAVEGSPGASGGQSEVRGPSDSAP